MATPARTRITARTAVFRGDRILLLHRSSNAANPGLWDLPGGHVESGETLATAARRETKEETGFDVRIRDLFDAQVYPSLSKRGTLRSELGIFFHCEAPRSKAPSLDPEEHTGFAWVRRSELSGYPTLPHLDRTVRAAFETRRAVARRARATKAPAAGMNAGSTPEPQPA